MKKLTGIILAIVLLSGCSKDDGGCQYSDLAITAPASEIANVQSYLAGIGNTTAIQHPSGLFYEIAAAGSGVKPGLCSGITVKYVGRLTNNSIFDQNLTGASFVLGQLIPGWQKGLPLIAEGGSIKLYVPPSLGYGSQASGSIPANSILIFDLQLVDVY